MKMEPVGECDEGDNGDEGDEASGAGKDPLELPLCPELTGLLDRSCLPTTVFDLWGRQLKYYCTRTALIVGTGGGGVAGEGEEGAAGAPMDEEDDDFGGDGPGTAGSAAAAAATSVAVPMAVEANVDDVTAMETQAMSLSVAMQRCYVVIRDLMHHHAATHFCKPVNPRTLPQYARIIYQPLSLSEIRNSLLQGIYRDSISNFYSDVNLLFENALAYNPENSLVNLNAQKLVCVFERMFLETVLCWDNALPFYDSCHGCRTAESVGDSKGVVCERCDSEYHPRCLDPPLSQVSAR